MKIMIADDSLVIRNSLKKLLLTIDDVGSIYESEDVLSTIRKIDEIKPDVLILDIMMRGGNGFDVMESVRKQDYKIIVIMLTNFTTEFNKTRSIKEKIDYFFDKSNEFEKVKEIIKELSKKNGSSLCS